MKTPNRGMIFYVFAGLLLVLGIAGPVGAQTAWTNTASGASGYWTNGVLWGTTVGNYPGSGASSAAYLTNNSDVAGGAYTAILNTTLNATISTLVISNSNGEAWLIVTNGAGPATVLTNTTFSLGTGGRLQIDNGGVVTGITSFDWSGTNGTIVLNNGGQLFSTAAISLTAGRTGLVTTANSPGGVWNLGAQSLSLNNGGALSVSGATLTNIGAGINVGNIAGAGNSLTLSNGARVFNAQELSVGFTVGANSNTVNVGGLGASSVFSNRAFSIGSYQAGWLGGSYNTLTVTNATFMSGYPGFFAEYIGFGSTSNTVNVLAGGTWYANPVGIIVGAGLTGYGVSTGNVLNINGGTVSNMGGYVYIGQGGAGSSGNGVTIANGGAYVSPGWVTVGVGAGDNSNYFNVGGVGAASTASFGQTVIGNTGAGNNSMTVTNASVTSSGWLFVGYGSSNNTVNVREGGTWNLGNNGFVVGVGNATGNVATVNNGILTNVYGVYVGGYSGSGSVGNTMTISNGAKVFSGGVSVGGVGDNNVLNIGGQGAASTWTNSGGFGVGSSAGNAYAGGSYNTMTISNATFWSGHPFFHDAIGSSSTNNTVNVLAGGTWTHSSGNNLYIGIGTSSAVSTGNVLNINGGIFTNISTLIIGAGTGGGGIGNGVNISNGGQYISPGRNIVVGNDAGDNNNYFNVGGVGAASTAISGQALIGANSSGNTANVGAGGTWNVGNNNFIVGYGNATGNAVTVNNGILTNVNALYVGAYTAGAVGNTMTISNGAKVFTGQSVVGGVAGNNSNTLNIGGLGAASTWTNALLGVGAAINTGAGGSYNTMTISNATFWSGHPFFHDAIGSSSTNNTVNVLAGGTWIHSSGNNLYVGIGTSSSVSTGNVVNINGGIFTNISTLIIGAGTGGGGIGNGVNISNGGQYISPGRDIVVGNDAGDSNNYLNVGGVGASSLASNRSIYVGNAGGGNNRMTVTNASLVNSGSVIVGNSSSNNTVDVQAGGKWNLGANNLYVGNGNATGNVLTVNNGILTNIGSIIVGNSLGSSGNTVTLNNGAQMFGGGFYVGNASGANSNTFNIGGPGAASTSTNSGDFEVGSGFNQGAAGGSFNTLNISNATVWAGSTSFNSGLGFSSTNNTINVLSNGTLNINAVAGSYRVGNGVIGSVGVGNVLNVNGGTVKSISGVTIGSVGATSNGVTVANGGTFIVGATGAGAVTVGNDAGASNNYYNVGGYGASSLVSNGTVTVGNTGAGYNRLTVTNATLFSTGVTVGSNSSNNTATVTSGGILQGNMTAGSGSATGNVVRVINGGVLEANTMTVGAGAGNVITNSGGVYQFTTASPSITPNGFGRIAINSGTISFRAISDADVFSDVSGTLNQISFSGANAFELNSASNTASVAQNYVFDTGRGATNYTTLYLAGNGSLWRSATLTIGSGGTFVASNTVGTVAATVTNLGSIIVNHSTMNWASNLVINGSYVSDPSTNNYAGDVTVGTNGLFAGGAGDLFNFQKSLFIQSTNKVGFQLTASDVQFSGGVAHTNTITGIDFGSNSVAYSAAFEQDVNFAYGGLHLGSSADTIYFASGNGSPGNGLYVGWVDLLGATNNVANLRAPTGINVYYYAGDSRNAYLENLTYQLSGGGFLIPIIPEPSAMALLAMGTCVLIMRRKDRS